MVKSTVKAAHAAAGPAVSAGRGTGRLVDVHDSAAVPRRLLAVASRLFTEKGFERTSVQEIVDVAGVTKGAMYHYFGSKVDLLYEICSRVFRPQPERWGASWSADSGSIPQRLHKAAADAMLMAVVNIDDMVTLSRSMHLLPPDKQAEIRAERRQYHEHFRSLIAEGQSADVFRDDKSADLLVYFYFGAVSYLWFWCRPDGP